MTFYSFQYTSLASLVKTFSKYFIHFDVIINENKNCFYSISVDIRNNTSVSEESFCPHLKTDEDMQVKFEG